MIAWMLYAGVISALMALAGLAAERFLAGTGRPRRFVWLTVLTLAAVIPLAGGFRGRTESVAGAHAGTLEDGSVIMAQVWSTIPPLPMAASPRLAKTAVFAWGIASASCLIAICAFLVFLARARLNWPQRQIDGAYVLGSRYFGPAVVGITKPTVVIPAWVFEGNVMERAAILRHENEHARAHDHLALLYAGLATAVLPWNPAVWWISRRLRAAVEMDCDRRVISSGIAAADYGRVLVGAATRSHGRCGLAPAIGQPKSLLERRLRTMNGHKIRLNHAHRALLAMATTVALGIACDVPAPTQLDEAIGEVVVDARGDLPKVDLPTVNLPISYLSAFVLIDGERIPIPEERAAYWDQRFRKAFASVAAGFRPRDYRIIDLPEQAGADLDDRFRKWFESMAPEY